MNNPEQHPLWPAFVAYYTERFRFPPWSVECSESYSPQGKQWSSFLAGAQSADATLRKALEEAERKCCDGQCGALDIVRQALAQTEAKP